ncbi:MAG: glycine zipper 2TM domain-containing protein [Rhodocyclaceae bacterium]|jgi:outer membrane lipoprotein SlyB|nr:glycine zipper 2TM domain-containing protein [Rhodocyclaceae bacterium]
MNRLPLALALAAAAVLGGCASSQSGSAYERRQARQEMSVRLGVVESVRRVTIEGTKSPVGAVAGAGLGGLAGSNIGRGRGSTAGAIVGAVIGGVAGSAVEEQVTKKEGLEITVKLDSGELIAVTQEADETFHPGERVRVLRGSGASRVTH